MSEAEERARVVALAREWIGTPYLTNAMAKGAGVDCAMLLVAVYREAGLIPAELDPRPYPSQWHLHRNEEQYKNIVAMFAREFTTAERAPEAGDVVLFKIGRLFAHGGIVTEWPRIVHARAPNKVWEEDVSLDSFGKHALWRTEMRFFSRW